MITDVFPDEGGPEKVILRFSTGIMAADGLPDSTEVSLSCGNLGLVSIDGLEMVIEMSDVANRSLCTVALSGITDLAGNALSGDNDVQINVHIGDVYADDLVNILDLSEVKKDLSKDLSNATCVSDVLTDGVINILDLSTVKTYLSK